MWDAHKASKEISFFSMNKRLKKIRINEHILQGARSHHMEKVTIIIKWWMRDTMRWHRKRKKKSWIKIRSSLENDNGKGQMKSIYIRTHVSTKRCKGKMWDNILNDFNGFSIVWHFVEFDFAFFRMATTGGWYVHWWCFCHRNQIVYSISRWIWRNQRGRSQGKIGTKWQWPVEQKSFAFDFSPKKRRTYAPTFENRTNEWMDEWML